MKGNKARKLVFLAVLSLSTIFLFFSSVASSTSNESTMTWSSIRAESLTVGITAANCLNYPTDPEVIVSVINNPQNTYNPNATVTATLYKPDGDTNSITFDNSGDGNYTKMLHLDQNGTFKLSLHAVDDLNASVIGDKNTYINVGSFDLNISFLNNNPAYDAGDTGSLRNFVLNSDGNAFTGLAGTISIYYPNSTAFANNAAMSELGSGEYYYNFTAPSTAGIYSATSTFACGLSTDSNSHGRFRVNEGTTPPVVPPVTQPLGGGGSSVGGTVLPELKKIDSVKRDFEPSSTEIMEIAKELGLNDQEIIQAIIAMPDLAISREISTLENISSKERTSEVTLTFLNTSETSLEALRIAEKIPKSLAENASMIKSQQVFKVLQEDPIILFEISLLKPKEKISISYTVAKEVEIQEVIKEFKTPIILIPSKQIKITEVTGFENAAPGNPAQISIKIANASAKKADFMLVGSILYSQEIEYTINQFVLDLKPGELREIKATEDWTPKYAGTHVISLKAMSLDGTTVFDQYTKSFNVQGNLLYDLKAECPTAPVTAGNEAELAVRVLNLGDYYKDTLVTYWIEGNGKEFGKKATPIALLLGEQRTIAANTLIPAGLASGTYSLKATVSIEGKETENAECSFTVAKEAGAEFWLVVLEGLLILFAIIVVFMISKGYFKLETIKKILFSKKKKPASKARKKKQNKKNNKKGKSRKNARNRKRKVKQRKKRR